MKETMNRLQFALLPVTIVLLLTTAVRAENEESKIYCTKSAAFYAPLDSPEYRKYAPDNATLQTLEAEARAAKVGLWRDPDPIPPWVFRRLKRGVAIDAADLPSLSGRPAL